MGRYGENSKRIAGCLSYKIQTLRTYQATYLAISRTFSSNFSEVSGFAII